MNFNNIRVLAQRGVWIWLSSNIKLFKGMAGKYDLINYEAEVTTYTEKLFKN